MIVIMRVVVAIVGMAMGMIVAAMGISSAKVRATLGRVGGSRLDEGVQVAPQRVESGGFLPRALVHIELAVHFDLQAVAVRGRVGKRPYQLHTPVGVAD